MEQINAELQKIKEETLKPMRDLCEMTQRHIKKVEAAASTAEVKGLVLEWIAEAERYADE